MFLFQFQLHITLLVDGKDLHLEVMEFMEWKQKFTAARPVASVGEVAAGRKMRQRRQSMMLNETEDEKTIEPSSSPGRKKASLVDRYRSARRRRALAAARPPPDSASPVSSSSRSRGLSFREPSASDFDAQLLATGAN